MKLQASVQDRCIVCDTRSPDNAGKVAVHVMQALPLACHALFPACQLHALLMSWLINLGQCAAAFLCLRMLLCCRDDAWTTAVIIYIE